MKTLDDIGEEEFEDSIETDIRSLSSPISSEEYHANSYLIRIKNSGGVGKIRERELGNIIQTSYKKADKVQKELNRKMLSLEFRAELDKVNLKRVAIYDGRTIKSDRSRAEKRIVLERMAESGIGGNHTNRLQKILGFYEEAKKAEDELVVNNLRFVVFMINKFQGKAPFLDLIQNGNMGMMHAASLYNPKKSRFTTYSAWWIRQTAQRDFAKRGSNIRIPINAHEYITKISKAIHDYEQKNEGMEPSPKQLMGLTGLSMKEIDTALLAMRAKDVYSLQREIGSEDSSSLEEMIPDRMAIPLDEKAEERERNEKLKEELKKVMHILDQRDILSQRDQEVLALRFGLAYPYPDGTAEEPLVREEISRRIKVSRERVRQIETRAMELIKMEAIKTKANFEEFM